MLADQANSAQPSFHASQSWPQDNSAAFRQCADRQATGDSQASAVDAARGFGYSHNQQYPQHGSQQAYQNNYAGQQYSHSQSSACSNQYPQQSQFISSIPSYNTAQTASQQGMANPYNASAYQNQYQQQSQPTQMASHYTQSQLQQAGPAQSMSGSYTQLPNSYSMHTQPSALSSQLSTTGSASSLAPSGSFASTTTAQQQTGTSIFGGDYISGAFTYTLACFMPTSSVQSTPQTCVQVVLYAAAHCVHQQCPDFMLVPSCPRSSGLSTDD